MALCSEDQIRQLESSYNLKLPAAYRAFLQGDYGDLSEVVEESGCDVGNLQELRNDATDLLAENGLPFTLGPQDFAFAMHEAHQFFFFRCDPEHDDPAVYAYIKGDSGPRRVYDSFSAWVQAMKSEARFLPKPQKDGSSEMPAGRVESSRPAENDRSSSQVTAPTREAAAALATFDISDLLTPDLVADLEAAGSLLQLLPPSTYQQLGRVLAVFRPSLPNAFAALGFGFLLMAGGGVFLGFDVWVVWNARFQLPLLAARGMSWALVLVALVFGFGLIFAGGVLFSRARRLLDSRLLFAENGFCWARRVKPQLLLWREVAEVQEISILESAPLKTPLRHLLPKSQSQQYVLRTAGGRQLSFSANNIREIAALRPMLERLCSARRIPWSVLKGQV